MPECWGPQHGRCVRNVCDCNPWFYGQFCEWKKCPDFCSSRGICLHLDHDNSECVCHPCWDGANCSRALPRMDAWHHIKPRSTAGFGRPLRPANRTRCGATMVCDELLVVGGEADDGTPLATAADKNVLGIGGQRGATSDAWVFDALGSWSWRPLALTPPPNATDVRMPPRHGHTVVWAHSRVAWVFGGMDGKHEVRNDLWEIDMEHPGESRPLHHTRLNRPEPRALHAATSDHEGTMWVFGGQTYALAHQRSPGSEGRVIVYLSDLWRVRCRPSDGSCGNQWGGGWNETRRQHNASDNSGGGMIWLKLDLFRNTSATNGSKDGPGPRASAALSHHVSERGTRRLLLFGGYNGGEYLDDLWEWSIWGSGHVDDAYYEGRTNPYPALLLPSTPLVSSRLSAFYPFRDAVGSWRHLTPPGVRPSARDTPMGLAQPRGGSFYVLSLIHI